MKRRLVTYKQEIKDNYPSVSCGESLILTNYYNDWSGV